MVDKLVRIQSNFLWGGDQQQMKIAWVKWETVCMPKEAGGLGVKDINSFNLSLLGKWNWNLFQRRESCGLGCWTQNMVGGGA